jgi:hypothetical protein
MRAFLLSAGCLFLASALFAPVVHASELAGGTLQVTRGEAAADCPDDVALRSATLALGTAPPASTGPLNVEVNFTRDDRGYVAHIRMTGRAEGEREVRKEGENCASLGEAVSVVLAVVFDLLPPPAPATVGAVPPARSAPQTSPLPARKPAGESRFSLGLGVQGGAAYGLLGDALVGAVSLALRPRVGHFELGLGGLWAPDRTIDFLEGSVHVSVLSTRLEGCAWLRDSPARLDAALCVGFLAGGLIGRGEGFSPDSSAVDGWFAFEAGAVGRWSVMPKWAFRLAISALVPTREQSFTVQGAEAAAFESSPAGVLFELGPEFAFL